MQTLDLQILYTARCSLYFTDILVRKFANMAVIKYLTTP